MTKTIHTVKTLITEDDFIKLKEVEPFASMRQDAKSCFPGNTKIIVEGRGEINLDTVVPSINPKLFSPQVNPLSILTPTGYVQVEATLYGETDTWIEIETESGDILRMTPNHLCPVVRDNRKQLIRADQLLESDKFLQL